MKFFSPSLIALSFIILSGSAVAEEKKSETATVEVKIDALTLNVPKTWEQKPPANKLRKGQFIIPKAEGDKDAAELVIFSFGGGGGGVQANIQRWIGQFDSKGRTAKTKMGKSPQGKYIFVDISGTYKKPIGPPIAGKTELLHDARMLAVILAVDEAKAVYYLRMAGEKKTITSAAEAFRDSFGADAKSEEDVKLGD